MRIRPFVLFARWSAGKGTGFPIWLMAKTFENGYQMQVTKQTFFFLTILRGSLKEIEKLREEGLGEKRNTLLLESFFNSPQFSISLNVQDGRRTFDRSHYKIRLLCRLASIQFSVLFTVRNHYPSSGHMNSFSSYFCWA